MALSVTAFMNSTQFNINGIEQVLFYFTIYSFFGWLLENVFSKVTTGAFWKEGFLYGPFKPMYGFAPILLFLFIKESTHWSIILGLCLIIPTLVEYITGEMLQRFFHQQWWDYSEMPFQLNGVICLPFSLCWFILSLVTIYGLHPYIASTYYNIENIWGWIFFPLVLYYFTDLFWTLKKRVKISPPSVG